MLKIVQKYSDEELVNTIKTQKDINPAILFLYQQHSESVSSFIGSKGGSIQDGEDIFQEVVVAFITIVKNDKYRGESSIRTFLVSIAKNIWYNEIRKRQSTGNRERIYENEKDTVEDEIVVQIGDLETKQQFRQLLDRLGDPCRKLLLLYYYENLSMKEMVEHLPYENEQVVRNKKYKCLKHLTKMVEQDPLIRQNIKR
jgi:RNA polymerase sigma factor (sigma-70 family)